MECSIRSFVRLLKRKLIGESREPSRATTEARGKVWLELDQFYEYETRLNVKSFMRWHSSAQLGDR